MLLLCDAVAVVQDALKALGVSTTNAECIWFG